MPAANGTFPCSRNESVSTVVREEGRCDGDSILFLRLCGVGWCQGAAYTINGSREQNTYSSIISVLSYKDSGNCWFQKAKIPSAPLCSIVPHRGRSQLMCKEKENQLDFWLLIFQEIRTLDPNNSLSIFVS